jgi:hypothetical protein
MKNVLFEQEKIKLRNKWCFMENEKEIMQLCIKNSANFPVA